MKRNDERIVGYKTLSSKPQDPNIIKHKIWAIALIITVTIIFVCISFINLHPFTLRLEMDNNTREAIQSINYTAQKTNTKDCLEGCYYAFDKIADNHNGQVISMAGFYRSEDCRRFCGDDI